MPLKNLLKLLLIFNITNCILTYPVSQPVYQSESAPQQQIQYQQQISPQQYLSAQIPQYLLQPNTIPVKEPEHQNEAQPTQQFAPRPSHQILPSTVDQQVQLAQQQYYQPQATRYQAAASPQYTAVPLSQPPQPQQVRYVAPSVTQATLPAPRPKYAPAPRLQLRPQLQPQQLQPQGDVKQLEPEDYDPSPSYQFGFDVKDDLYTNYQNRKEQREGDKITGSYSVVDSDGFIRTVTYTADPKEGFKAEVNRQPTDIVVKIPTPQPQLANNNLLRQQQTQQYLEGSQSIGRAPPSSPKQRVIYQYQ